ncbi:MAG: TetR/AcrR family transcriptional regulator [Deltaproteobacteria bacterium]|nr:TetR/AcrR family transcriptional regulator [Deltaproteobacteria bacterium]MBW2360528.1 TetR/AcrR family transcriptional regulator [Deltaproteobacteria bacterium]
MTEPIAPEPTAPGRRERRKLEVRQRILDAALALFDEQGFLETTVADICERADVAHKTFFNHFPSKQDLFRELAGLGLESVLFEIETACREGRTTRDRLERFFAVVADRATHRELLTDMVNAVHESADKSEHARKFHDAFGAIIQAGLAAGDVTRRHDAETLTEMVLGAYYVLMFSFANVDDFPIRRQAMSAASFLADALAPLPEE